MGWFKECKKRAVSSNRLYDMAVLHVFGEYYCVKFEHPSGYVISVSADGGDVCVEDPTNGSTLHTFETSGEMLSGIIKANEFLNKYL